MLLPLPEGEGFRLLCLWARDVVERERLQLQALRRKKENVANGTGSAKADRYLHRWVPARPIKGGSCRAGSEREAAGEQLAQAGLYGQLGEWLAHTFWKGQKAASGSLT